MWARRLGRASLAAVYVAPWAWLLCLAIFVSAVTWKVGHFPTYSQPDPKHVEGLAGLYLLTMILLLLACLSPVVAGAQFIWAKLGGREHILGWDVAVYALGVALSAAVIVGDAFGLRTWLLD